MTGLLQPHLKTTKKITGVLVGCFFLTSTLILGAACTKSEVDIKPVEIKPIHITIDINLKVDRELDDYFNDIDKIQEKQQPPAKHRQ
jgi:hypothetical protein